MTVLAVTYAVVLTMTSQCSDDHLLFTPSSAPDIAGYRIRLNGVLQATATQPAYNLGCVAGTVCVEPVDISGNAGGSTCTNWDGNIGTMAVIERSCSVGCKPVRRSGACCVAPLSILPQGE